MTWKAFVPHNIGETIYAKPLQLTDSPWSGDVLARTGVQFGSSEFDCDDAVDNYGFFLQSGGSPANTDAMIDKARRPLDAADIREALGMGAANLDTRLEDIPTVAEFEARTLVAANYFDPTTDVVTTDSASRSASQADVSQIQTDLTTLDTLIDALTTELAKVPKVGRTTRHRRTAGSTDYDDTILEEAS